MNRLQLSSETNQPGVSKRVTFCASEGRKLGLPFAGPVAGPLPAPLPTRGIYRNDDDLLFLR